MNEGIHFSPPTCQSFGTEILTTYQEQNTSLMQDQIKDYVKTDTVTVCPGSCPEVEYPLSSPCVCGFQPLSGLVLMFRP